MKKPEINKYGLKRYIPSEIRRVIRQRCGFGCVICGLAFYDYEHFDPEFTEAKEHNPDGMTILCSQCNQKKARTKLSAYTVAKANKNPKCLQQGFANEMFDFHEMPIRIKFAGVEFYDCTHLIQINGMSILSVLPPEKAGEPVRLSGYLSDSQGRESITIDDNEFSVNSGSWDITTEGDLIVFREKLRDISLQIRLEAPTGIVIEKIDMLFRGVRLIGDKKELRISLNNGKNFMTLANCSMSHCFCGIALNSPYRMAANDDGW